MRSSHGRMDNRLSRGISTYPLALTPRRAQIPESQRGRYTKYHLKTGWIRRSICTDPWLSLQSDNRSARCSRGGSRSSITHPIIRNPYILASPIKRASTNNYHLCTQRVALSFFPYPLAFIYMKNVEIGCAKSVKIGKSLCRKFSLTKETRLVK